MTVQGRFDEAIDEAERAIELDPFSLNARACLAWRYYLARRYQESLRLAQQAILLDRSFAMSHLQRGVSLIGMNRCEEALPELQLFHSMADNSLSLGALGYGLARAGHEEQARSTLTALLDLREREFVCVDTIAAVYLGLGDTSTALDWLERVVEKRPPGRVELPVNPIWDDLRDEPRFRALIEQLGLPSHDCRLNGLSAKA